MFIVMFPPAKDLVPAEVFGIKQTAKLKNNL